ncbi:MAG: hypothetical protein HQM16_14555 [Deltaproteobacteria bacterium]|nr:hypothetical protein [Deltaproteobacteria bacterium]
MYHATDMPLGDINTHSADKMPAVAKKIGAQIINYDLREFIPAEKGIRHNEIMQRVFNAKPLNVWQGSVCHNQFIGIENAIDQIYKKKLAQFFLPLMPVIAVTPKGLKRSQAKKFYLDYDYSIGVEACLMPSYFIKIYSDGLFTCEYRVLSCFSACRGTSCYVIARSEATRQSSYNILTSLDRPS